MGNTCSREEKPNNKLACSKSPASAEPCEAQKAVKVPPATPPDHSSAASSSAGQTDFEDVVDLDTREFENLPGPTQSRFDHVKLIVTATRGSGHPGVQLAGIRIWKPSGEECFPTEGSSVTVKCYPGRSLRGNEPDNIFDGRLDTKWVAVGRKTVLDVEFGYPVDFGGYTLVTGKGHPEWDPTAWMLVGCEPTGWKLLDMKGNVAPPDRCKEYTRVQLHLPRGGSPAQAPGRSEDRSFSAVKFKFTNIRGGLSTTHVSLSRIRLFSPQEIDLRRAIAEDESLESNDAEGAENTIDGTSQTTWNCALAFAEIVIELPTPKVLSAYTFTTTQAHPERDPTSWVVFGQVEGSEEWTEIDQQKRIKPPEKRRASYEKYPFGGARRGSIGVPLV